MSFIQEGMGIGFADREGETMLDTIAMVGVGVMSGLHTPFFLTYFEIPEELVSPNESILIDEELVFGRLFYSDSTLGYELIELGTFYGGSISFDEWSTEDESLIQGSISSSYYAFREISE